MEHICTKYIDQKQPSRKWRIPNKHNKDDLNEFGLIGRVEKTAR